MCSQAVLVQILDNVQQQRIAVTNDDDLMLSSRDGCYGSKIDDDSLTIQLYLNNTGLTNPIGAKKDQHKLSMMSFSLEDMPDQYRSQLDFIHLVGLCQSKILKVKYLMLNWLMNIIFDPKKSFRSVYRKFEINTFV